MSTLAERARPTLSKSRGQIEFGLAGGEPEHPGYAHAARGLNPLRNDGWMLSE